MKPRKRIAFVIPSSFKRKFNFIHSSLGLKLLDTFSHFVFYNTGTLLLASIVKQMGHDVTLYFDRGTDSIRDEVDGDVICISLTTAAAPRGYEIASLFSDRKVIIGGPHASALPHEAAQYADHVVIGEGEKVLPHIIDGRISSKIVNGGLIENLDELPYLDFSLLPFRPKNFPILTSRGCPFNCSFCAVTKMFGGKVRTRSPRSIVEEVKYYIEKYGRVDRLDLISPNFTIQKRHCKETLKLLLAEGIKPALEIRSSTHMYKDPEIPELLSRFPVVSVLVGVESLEEKHLKSYKKKRDNNEFYNFMEQMREYNLKACLSFIWGNKYDTPDSIWRLLDTIYAIHPAHFHISLLTPFPGTDFYNEVEKDIFTTDWRHYDLMHVTHFHPRMDPYTMQTTWIKAQKQIWSLSNMIKNRIEIFSPPINKFFYFLLTRFADGEFKDFLEFLRGLGCGVQKMARV
jgi:radical SAM superfamily enzyme YgiQ (UPF0313 family)